LPGGGRQRDAPHRRHQRPRRRLAGPLRHRGGRGAVRQGHRVRRPVEGLEPRWILGHLPEGDTVTSSAEQLDALLSALGKLPPYHGLSYRGYAGRQGPGFQRALTSPVLVATSRDPRVATENFSTDGLYAVIGSRGREIATLSRHPQEQEVVFRPGSMFL